MSHFIILNMRFTNVISGTILKPITDIIPHGKFQYKNLRYNSFPN